MELEQAINTIAAAHAGLAALIGDRFYYAVLPSGCALPAVTFFVVDDPHDHITNLGHARVQFTSWASGYPGAKAVDKQIADAFVRFKGIVGDLSIEQGVNAVGPFNLDPETVDQQQRYGRQRDVYFHYRGVV